MAVTAKGIPYPTSTDDGDIPADFSAMATKIDDLFGSTAANNNLLYNPQFVINQRGAGVISVSGDYIADGWKFATGGSGTTTNITRSSATTEGLLKGIAWARTWVSGSQTDYITQKIEDVRFLSGQTVTISFWGNATATYTLAMDFEQYFGPAGSSNVITSYQQVNLTTTLAYHKLTFAIPSVSSKTITTDHNTNLRFWIDTSRMSTGTLNIYNVKVELGSKSTAFLHRPYTQELQLCQRYYYRIEPNSTNGRVSTSGVVYATTGAQAYCQFPVQMRKNPTLTTAAVGNFTVWEGGVNAIVSSFALEAVTDYGANITCIVAGMTQGKSCFLTRYSNASPCWIAFSAEL